MLAGCSGTRFGDQLARSFSSPGASAPAAGSPGTPANPNTAATGAVGAARPGGPANPSAVTAGATPAGPGQTIAPAGGSAGSVAGVKAPAAGKPAQAPGQAAPPRAQPLSPAPYRVTIKLPGADPSAPAEAVTRALRSAGVSFEVETIERIAPAGSAAAPAPAVQSAPVLTPAPAPR